MKILKNRMFLVLATAIIVGSITAYATISPNSESILYDNTNSGLTSTNMQDAIDELYTKASASSSCEGNNLLKDLIGHTVRIKVGKIGYTGTRYETYFYGYLDGDLVASSYCVSEGCNGSASKTPPAGTYSALDNPYTITYSKLGSYSQSTYYTHAGRITINGKTIYTSSYTSQNNALDSGDILITEEMFN